MNTGLRVPTSRNGCRNCIQRFRGADSRRRCRIHGGIARLIHSAERVCNSFVIDIDRKDPPCSCTSSSTD